MRRGSLSKESPAEADSTRPRPRFAAVFGLRRVHRSKETSSLWFALPDRSTPAIKLICHWIIGTMVEAIIRRWCRHVGGGSVINPREIVTAIRQHYSLHWLTILSSTT